MDAPPGSIEAKRREAVALAVRYAKDRAEALMGGNPREAQQWEYVAMIIASEEGLA